MSARGRLTAFIIMAILLCFSVAYYFIFTTAGSVWLIKKELIRQVKSSGVAIGSSSGSLWQSVLIEDIKLNDLMVHGANARVAVKKATIKLAWKNGLPNFQIAAEVLRLEPDQFIEEALAETLKLEGNNLTLENVAIRNASKIPGENKIEIGQLSVKYPIEENNALRAERISIKFQDTDVLIALVSGKPENLTFENIQVSNRSLLKKPISAQIQKLDIAEPFTPKNITSIQNGRVALPGSDPILIYGKQLDGQLDVHVFAKHAELTDVLVALKVPGVSLDVGDLEISLNGSLDQVKITGGLTVNRASYRRFILRDVLAPTLDLTLNQNKRVYELVGVVDIQSGDVIHRTTQLQFKPGRIIFKGDPESPLFDLDASAKIADTDIDLRLRGTPHKPELLLSSNPPYPEEKILVMLATGKEWTGSEKAIAEGRVSLDAINEFIDYFVLGGTGEKFAKRFGIKELSFRADEYTKGVEVKKRISKKMDVGYGVEKNGVESEKSVVAQKLGMDYKASANTLISVEGKVSSKAETSDKLNDQDALADKSLTMKVKRSF